MTDLRATLTALVEQLTRYEPVASWMVTASDGKYLERSSVLAALAAHTQGETMIEEGWALRWNDPSISIYQKDSSVVGSFQVLGSCDPSGTVRS